MHASSRAVPSLHPSQSPNDSNDCSLSAPRSPSLVGCGRAEHAFWALLMMAKEPVHIVTVFRDLLGSSGPFLFSVSRLLQQTCLKQGQPGSSRSAAPLEACGVDYLFGIFDRQDSSHERQVRGKKAWSRFCFVLQPADGRERARTVRPSV
mmetsp:Transcript_61946/g.138020  ORF Transcript_61946/g.138020 Transcript_61946/m.138020 type:complete len:150 (-) Transcript_61946:161-610(-)